MAVLRDLTADALLALPLPDLGLAALVDWWERPPTSGYQWVKGHHKRLGRDEAVRLALLEALHWLSNQGYLARDLNTVSDTHYFVTRLGQQALGVSPR